MDVDDYDEYFDDIDEQTLASLNELEQKNVSKRPSKRQKLHHAPDAFELDELPEISVQNNFYSTEIDSFVSERHQRPPITTRNNHANADANPRPQLATRNPHSSSQSSNSVQLNVRTGSAGSARQLRQGNSQRSNSRLAIIASALANSATPTAPAPPQMVDAGPDPRTLDQIDTLKRRLDQVHEENTRIQNLLREAQNARFSKEGEVTVLRKNIEKTAREHASQLTKLRVSREEADAKQLNMQREMKAELARLKSELTFKQTEVEAHSLRKPPVSIRKKQTQPLQFPPQTPVRNGRVINTVLPDNPTFQTPLTQLNRYSRSPEASRKSSSLPGFVNAFDQSNVDQPKQRHSKPIPGASQSELNDNPFIVTKESVERDPPPNSVFNSSPPIQRNDDILMDDPPGVTLDPSHNIDQEMEDPGTDTSGDDESVSDVPAPPFYCNPELTRVVLTHTHAVTKLPTLQFLVESAASNPDFVSAGLFSSSISCILEVLSNTFGDFAYEYSISILTRCLVEILTDLRVNNLIPPLISVLNLLTVLLRSFPDFHLSLLSYSESESDDRSNILVLLSQIIIEYLNPSITHNFTDTLTIETFNLLESLIWNVPQNLVVKLSVFCCNRELSSILFHTAQSHSFLSCSTRFLALLFSYPKMYEYCVVNTTDTNEDGSLLDFGRTVNLDRLCSLLIDVHRNDPDAISVKHHILMFFTALSLAHSEALNLLASSLVFVPSLITHIAYLARPIWEEEDAESFDPQFRPVSLTIRALSKTLSLLHHIIFNATPPVNLPDKFLRAHPHAFNGINHNFIVTFGRLSYAGAPDWIDVEGRRVMTGMIGRFCQGYPYQLYNESAEMASELLELVVDGPEGDGVWLMYQDRAANEARDEGEMEREVTGPETALCQS